MKPKINKKNTTKHQKFAKNQVVDRNRRSVLFETRFTEQDLVKRQGSWGSVSKRRAKNVPRHIKRKGPKHTSHLVAAHDDRSIFLIFRCHRPLPSQGPGLADLAEVFLASQICRKCPGCQKLWKTRPSNIKFSSGVFQIFRVFGQKNYRSPTSFGSLRSFLRLPDQSDQESGCASAKEEPNWFSRASKRFSLRR